MSLTLEWGIEFLPDWEFEPEKTQIVKMRDEETANDVCQDGQHVVFRYVGDWKRADA